MSLYLCVFKQENEVDGIEIGSYSDFGLFRDSVRDKIEGGVAGSRYPVLMLHSDCDGIWSFHEAGLLLKELFEIANSFKEIPPEEFHSEWQKKVSKSTGLNPANLYECFIDIDGEFLIERLIGLCQLSQNIREPILFQ